MLPVVGSAGTIGVTSAHDVVAETHVPPFVVGWRVPVHANVCLWPESRIVGYKGEIEIPRRSDHLLDSLIW